MRNKFLLIFALLFVFAAAPATFAQGVKAGPDPATLRDPDLERDSLSQSRSRQKLFQTEESLRCRSQTL
jgi:hypothetical protein